MTFPMQPEIPRDRWDRPLILKLDGSGKRTPYTRCTTFVRALDDTYKLNAWMQRMVGVGLSQRKDLLLAFAALAPELLKPTTEVAQSAKDKGDALCDAAREAAGSSAAATTGSALHKIFETHDRGELVGSIPADAAADLAAYERATKQLEAIHIERLTVLDEYAVAGTPDRIVDFDGERYIADVKTGSLDFGVLKVAMQLSVYSRSELYDTRTDQRLGSPGVNQDRAIVIHLPAGTADCRLLWVEIGRAWPAIDLAGQVRQWRKEKDWLSELTGNVALTGFDEAMLGNAIATAGNAEQLVELWRSNRDKWSDELSQLAAARKALILGGVA